MTPTPPFIRLIKKQTFLFRKTSLTHVNASQNLPGPGGLVEWWTGGLAVATANGRQFLASQSALEVMLVFHSLSH